MTQDEIKDKLAKLATETLELKNKAEAIATVLAELHAADAGNDFADAIDAANESAEQLNTVYDTVIEVLA